MKNSIWLLSTAFLTLNAAAQDLRITFAGTGESITVDSVKVEDLSRCSTLSGNNRTVIMLIPDHDQTVVFPFIRCTDAVY